MHVCNMNDPAAMLRAHHTLDKGVRAGSQTRSVGAE